MFPTSKEVKKSHPTINFIRQLPELMMGEVIYPKYLDPGSPVVDVHINDTIFPHTLIDLGFAINMMNKDTMLTRYSPCMFFVSY